MAYESFDGIYAGKTDLKWVTVGLAQYDPADVAVKTMRHTGSKWSRQAEELPVHRPIDMTIVLNELRAAGKMRAGAQLWRDPRSPDALGMADALRAHRV